MSDNDIQSIKIIDIKNEIIKPLTENSKKGDNGCITTIGGSLEYTGAPYYSAISSLKAGKRVAVVIGPEGGFCEAEVEYAKNNGYIPVGLGNRILRAETASIYALSVIANRLEDK